MYAISSGVLSRRSCRRPVLSEVDVETPAGIVTSVVTSRSLTADLDLKVGSEVLALVKSTEVALAKL